MIVEFDKSSVLRIHRGSLSFAFTSSSKTAKLVGFVSRVFSATDHLLSCFVTLCYLFYVIVKREKSFFVIDLFE